MTTINLSNFKVFDIAMLSEDEIFGLHEENYDLSRDEGCCGPAHPEEKNWFYNSAITGDRDAMVADIMSALESYSEYVEEMDRQNELANCPNPCCLEGGMCCKGWEDCDQ